MGDKIFLQIWKDIDDIANLNKGDPMSDLAKQYYQEGLKNLQNGVFPLAKEMFQKATKEMPNQFDSWNLLGLTCQFQKDWAGCEAAWQEALRCNPNSIDTKLNLGIAKIALQKSEDAEQLWLSIIKQDSNHIQSLINLGLFYRERERNKEAHSMWEKAHFLHPNNAKLKEWLADVKGILGMIFVASQMFEKAEPLLKEAVILDPTYAALWGYLSEWHFQKREFKEAFATCSKAINLEPENPLFHHTMGNILRMTDQTEQALIAYQKALDLGSRHPATYRAIAELTDADVEENEQVIQLLFDQYAEHFEQDLQQKLLYKTPTEAKKMLNALAIDCTVHNILDLGCGTGLSILPFLESQQEYSEIVGIDLSSNMLRLAKEKNIYTELHDCSMKEFLLQDTRKFDLILCLDALVYIRNLEDILQNIYHRIAEKGLFIFSTEQNDAEKPMLQRSGRYAHPQPFVKELIQKIGWTLVASKNSLLRKDGDRWIKGNIWILQK